jgi:hypothetical protein
MHKLNHDLSSMRKKILFLLVRTHIVQGIARQLSETSNMVIHLHRALL